MSAPKNKTCSIPACEKPIHSRGWCAAHYSRFRRHGDVNAVKPKFVRKYTRCNVLDCVGVPKALGYCTAHYKRFKKWGDPLIKRPRKVTPPLEGVNGAPAAVSAQGLPGCVINECGEKIVGRGRCRKHYAQWHRATAGTDRIPAFNMKSALPEERFRAKFKQGAPDECWVWTGATESFGHGQFFVSPERGTVPAHGYAKELATGERCPAGLESCHHCDNPPCVNPDHIYYGTRQQNVDDMWRRGRANQGEATPHALLTEAQVVLIRQKYADGEMQKTLALAYGVSTGSIFSIVHGLNWKQTGGPITPTSRNRSLEARMRSKAKEK